METPTAREIAENPRFQQFGINRPVFYDELESALGAEEAARLWEEAQDYYDNHHAAED